MYHVLFFIFFFNDTATTEIYTLSLHDALPICPGAGAGAPADRRGPRPVAGRARRRLGAAGGERLCCDRRRQPTRSEEHTSELQSRQYLVCRLLLEKKKKNYSTHVTSQIVVVHA